MLMAIKDDSYVDLLDEDDSDDDSTLELAVDKKTEQKKTLTH